MSTTETATATWHVIGRSPLGRIVAREAVDDLRLAHKVAATWRGHGMSVEVKEVKEVKAGEPEAHERP